MKLSITDNTEVDVLNQEVYYEFNPIFDFQVSSEKRNIDIESSL